MKIWIGVEVFQGVINDVEIFFNDEEAEVWFKKITGYCLDDFYSFRKEAAEPDFDGSNLYELDITGLRFFKLKDLVDNSLSNEVERWATSKR